MALKPTDGENTVVEGHFEFSATYNGRTATDTFELRIVIKPALDVLPKVWELGGRIPREPDSHAYPDGSLCLGSPIRLRMAISRNQTLLSFCDECIVPFLYAASLLEQGQQTRPLGELAHGSAGLIRDYEELFGVSGRAQVLSVLSLLQLRKRAANKRPCPCGCRRRVGRCPLHRRINPLRFVATRRFFAQQMSELPLDTGE
jgi:hypothetical protein